MANADFYIAPQRIYSGSTGLTFGVMGLMGNITVTGDTLNIYFDYQLQVSSVASFTDNVVKSGTTDSVTREFRTSTDGTTWTAYAALTNPNLAALVLNANNLFYINIRYTRTGASAGGFVSIQGLTFNATINPDATPTESWTFTNMNVREKLKAFFPEAFKEYVYQVNGGDHYAVKYNDRYTCTVENKPVIYFFNLNTGNQPQRLSDCLYSKSVSMNIGIKRRCEDKGYETQLTNLIEMFNPYAAQGFKYNIFGHKGATLYDFGLNNLSTTGLIELRDAECQCEMHEFNASFDLIYSVHRQ